MKLGLLGFPVKHSLSPKIYEKLLGRDLTSYDLFSYENAKDIPSLEFFSRRLQGLNITSPYKTHFIKEIRIESDLVREIGAVNTLKFSSSGVVGTNTDVLAVEEILLRFKTDNRKVKILLLGDGVMARVTKLVAEKLGLDLEQFSRKSTKNVDQLDLSIFKEDGVQNIIINSCSRDFIFKGKTHLDDIFWDYNYSFLPHQNSLPSLVKAYYDGQEMLELQAIKAIEFWKN